MDRFADDISLFFFHFIRCILVLLYVYSVLHWYTLHTKLPDYFFICLVLGADFLFRSSCFAYMVKLVVYYY
jgi:hypothetical protein